MKGLIVEDHQVRLHDQLELPFPRKGEVLVRVHCASVNPFDLEMAAGKYDFIYKFYGGQKPVKSGLEFSGTVERSGDRFKEGDRVYGYVDLMRGWKSHCEYITVHEDYMALMPPKTTFEQAAALPLGALTSLTALEELGEVEAGMRVLIIGAAGGLGVFAVQLGRLFDLEVITVAGPGQEAFLHDLGAQRVINYEEQDILSSEETYDLILDLTTRYRFGQVKPILKPKGSFIPTDPLKNSMDFALSLFSSRKAKYLMVDKGDHEKLSRITDWINKGTLRPVVDSVFKLEDHEKAFQRVAEKGRQGRVVMVVED